MIEHTYTPSPNPPVEPPPPANQPGVNDDYYQEKMRKAALQIQEVLDCMDEDCKPNKLVFKLIFIKQSLIQTLKDLAPHD